jgi:hypothetical protein
MTGFLVNLFLRNRLFTVGAFLFFLIGLIIINNPAVWIALVVALSAGLSQFSHWYYNERLLCIRDRDCAIGTVISPPAASFDGDRKLNLMLAPYGQRTFVETLLDHIATNEAMLIDNARFNDSPFHTSAPALPVATQRENDFDILRDYLHRLHSEDPDDGDAEAFMYSQLLIGVIDSLMDDPARNFYNRFYRKDSVHIPVGSALSNAIPEDFDSNVNWQGPNAVSGVIQFNPYSQKVQGLNPMFRFDIEHLVAYLHCEIDGYAIALLIQNLILALWAWVIAMLALLALLGPFAPLAALIIAAFLFFLKWFIDEATGNDGDADAPDVDWDDPDVPGAGETQRVGDVVVTYGNWIMDTEHQQFFEIHPVRAYYIIARNALGQEPVLVNGNMEQEEFGHENFDPTQIDSARADAICQIITQGEEGTTPPVILRTAPTALSYGMQTRYAGGQQQVQA